MPNSLDFSKELIGRRALVTGGSRGIGAAIAQRLLDAGGSDEFSKANPAFSSDDWLRYIPLGRIGATEDIAEAVALLVSDRAKFMTGANYRVDGGMTAA